MPSPFLNVKRATWLASRRASQGAGITLVYGSGCMSALFECAQSVAAIIGNRDLQDFGDGIEEVIPYIQIPFENLHSALTRLSQKHSIAIVDTTLARDEVTFVLLWKIEQKSCAVETGLETLEQVLQKPGVKVIDPFF